MEDHQQQGECLPLPRQRTDAGKVMPMKLTMQPGGLAVEVSKPDTIVGRHGSADLRLPLPDISRQHCRLVYQGGCWQIIDLNSLNGVYVNNEKVQSAVLKHRDLIRLGGFTFEVDIESGQSTVKTPAAQSDRMLRSIANVLQAPTEEEPRRQAS